MDKKTARKNEILGASINVMYLNGYNGTSVKDITDAAGIPKGSFYHYFEGKEAYAVDAINYYSEIGQESFDIFTDASMKPLERILKFYQLKVDILCADMSLNGCFVGNLTEEVGSINIAIGKAVESFHQKLELLIFDNLVEARKDGDLNNSIDDGVLKSFIVSAWQGALLRSKVKDKNKHLNNFMIVLNENLLR